MRYRVHISDIGWSDWVQSGMVAGTTGQNKKIEAIEIDPQIKDLELEYQVHLTDVGWVPSVKAPATAGTVGENRAIEAIAIAPKGPLAGNYDLWYRVHVQDVGWLSWQGQEGVSGSTGGGKQIEAIQIYLCTKGAMYLADDVGARYLTFTPPTPAPPPAPEPAPAPQPSPADKRRAVVATASSCVGYQSEANNDSHFAEHFGMPCAEWCHLFVDYCYDVNGLGDLVPMTAYCPDGSNWFLNHPTACFYRRGAYLPDAGDLIYFDWDENGNPNHVGMVEACEDGVVHTIEGNTGDPVGVYRKAWDVDSPYILGYGVPAF